MIKFDKQALSHTILIGIIAVLIITSMAFMHAKEMGELKGEVSLLKDSLNTYQTHYIRAMDSDAAMITYIKGDKPYKAGDCVWVDEDENIISADKLKDHETMYLYIIMP